MSMTDRYPLFAALPRLSEDDPLPPEDRVLRPIEQLDQIYRSQAPKLLRYFSRRTNPQDANDLVHDSFARFAQRAAENGDDIESPQAYLGTVAANLLRDRAKSALQRSLARTIPFDEAELVGHDPMISLEARDQLARLQAALARLSPKTRAIFLAHRVDGLSYKQIAERYGLSVKGVEWHMGKAIDHLDRAVKR